VVLISPEGADPQLSSSIQSLLADLAAQAGWRLDVQPSLAPANLGEDVKVVVVLPPDPGLAELVAAAPQTQFLAVGIPGAEAEPNLSVIGAQGASPDQNAFLAGYLAATITPDWRVGVLYGTDAVGKSSQLGFASGVVYFCGLCRPAFPPFPQPSYPLLAELGEGAGQVDWQTAAEYFNTWDVRTVYVDPGIASTELLEFLSEEGFHLISAGPRPEGIQDNWVASITGGDLLQAVRQVWPDLVDGKGQASVDLGMTLTDVNEALLSPGRQRLVEEIMTALAGGFIDTGVNE
jgi:hypothetical protein